MCRQDKVGRSANPPTAVPVVQPTLLTLILAHMLLGFRLPPHCFYKTIDAFSGCLYPQPRYIFPPTLRKALK